MAMNPSVPSTTSNAVTLFNARYAMTRAQVNNLIGEMQQSSFLSNVALLFDQPIDNIISLYCYPFDVKAVVQGSAQTADDVIIVNIITMATTGTFLAYRTPPLISLGEYTFTRATNDFRDYAPYTSIELYLPYIGFVDLDPGIVQGEKIAIDYAVDLYSGKCTAYLSVVHTEGGSDVKKVFMVRDGQIGFQVQIAGGSGADIARKITSTSIGAVGAVVGAATGGAAAAVSGVSGTLLNVVNNSKIASKKGGTNDPATALYGPQNAYLIITRPTVVRPTNYDHDVGRPLMATRVLSTISGYTEVERVHVEGNDFAQALDAEKREIEALLKSGVIL